jgi:hypothetical protein
MRFDQASHAVADQQRLEDAVAANGGRISPSSVTITPIWPAMEKEPIDDRRRDEAGSTTDP